MGYWRGAEVGVGCEDEVLRSMPCESKHAEVQGYKIKGCHTILAYYGQLTISR
jgi:hypothetical protein